MRLDSGVWREVRLGKNIMRKRGRGEGEGEEVPLPSLPTPPFFLPFLRAVPTHNLNAWNRLVKHRLTHENFSNIPLTYAYIRIRIYIRVTNGYI